MADRDPIPAPTIPSTKAVKLIAAPSPLRGPEGAVSLRPSALFQGLSANASLMSCPRCSRRAKSSADLASRLMPFAHSLLSPFNSALVVFTRASKPSRARAGM